MPSNANFYEVIPEYRWSSGVCDDFRLAPVRRQASKAMRTLIAFTFAIAAFAHADERHDRFLPQWQATCQIPGHTFRLNFKSASGDPAEDDMETSMQWDSRPPIFLSLKRALFVKGMLKSEVTSQCDNLTGLLLQTGNLLLLLRRDERPSENSLIAVLLNGKTGNVIDVMYDLGTETDKTLIAKDQPGFRVRLIRRWRQTTPQQEPTPVIEWVKLIETDGKLNKPWGASTP
jgi:hypothetical protein